MSELDRLLSMARQAEPDPLSEADAQALVRSARARAESSDGKVVERVLEEARRAEPDPLSERELRSMAQHAAMTGRARHRRWTRWRVTAASAMAATLAAAAVTFFVLPREERAPVVQRSEPHGPAVAGPTMAEPAVREPAVREPTDLDLPTGDRLMAASGARFEVELPEAHVRRVRLGGGSMLFDVRPIEEGRFSVSTPNAEVVVLGTVFSVRATEEATTVWVYEGAVRVRGPEGERVVEAGGVLHLGAGQAGADELASAGRAAAIRRTGEAAEVAPERAEEPAVVTVRAAPPRPAPSIPEPRSEAAEPAETPSAVRALIAQGDAARALDITEDAIARGENDPWRMLQGDALRVLGRAEQAASAYERAAAELPAPRKQQAGFLAARVRMTALNDAAGALRALREAGVTAPGSVLRERGMAMEVELLTRTGRRSEAREVAAEYLRAYPDGPDAEAMRAHAAAP